MHPSCGVSTLAIHRLETESESAVSEISLQRNQVHNLLAFWVVEHGLGLKNYTIWQVEVTHGHSSLVGSEPEDSGLHFVWILVRISIAGVHTGCHFETGSLLIGEHPLATQLEVISERKHHIQVEPINCLMLLKNSAVLHYLLERIWL
mgnify:CR=1 FL=1